MASNNIYDYNLNPNQNSSNNPSYNPNQNSSNNPSYNPNQNSSNKNTYDYNPTYNPDPFDTNNQSKSNQNSSKSNQNTNSSNQNSSKNTTSIDTEYTCTTGVAAFNKNEMISLSDNYANFGSVELNTDPCEQEFKFYTDINGKKILTGEDTRNIFEELKKI